MTYHQERKKAERYWTEQGFNAERNEQPLGALHRILGLNVVQPFRHLLHSGFSFLI